MGDSLQDAIDAAAINDTILEDDTTLTFSEPLVINKDGLALSSATPQASTLIGEIQIAADNVTIKDFILENPDSGRIISMKESDGTLIDNNLLRNSERGIQGYQYEATNLTVSNSTFETETGIISTHNILTMELNDNIFETSTAGVRLQGNNQTTVTSISENNSFITDNDIAVIDERGTSNVTYDDEGYLE